MNCFIGQSLKENIDCIWHQMLSKFIITCHAIDQPCTTYSVNSCFREIVQPSKVWHANLNSTFFFIKSFFPCLSLSCFTCFLHNIDYQCASHTLSLLFPFDWSCQGSLATSRMVWCCDLVRNCATMGTWSDGCCLMRAKILNSRWFCAQKLRCAVLKMLWLPLRLRYEYINI